MAEKNVRRAAVSALRAWSKGHLYADSLVERQARRNHLSTPDRALLNSILLAVLRNRSLLDHWIGMLRKGKLDHETRDILRVGICQLLLLGIPDHAAVNETVNCARKPVRGLINAVLRRAVAARKTLFSESESLRASIKFSHPEWLCNRWTQQFGRAEMESLLAWNNEPAPVIVRLNTLASHPLDPAKEDQLISLGLESYYQLAGPLPREWAESGQVYIQDPSTRNAVELLDPQPGETVLDACAAPGGKSSLIAAAMNNEGQVLCTDSSEKRIPRLIENLARQQITNTTTEQFDWTEPAPQVWKSKFDRILLDVPCSNSGVMRRRVDARWRLKPEQLQGLPAIQRLILENALPCLKQGGRLVYSTCSLEPEENEVLILSFLKDFPEVSLLESKQSIPFRDGFDGSYAALLSKKGSA